MTDTPDGSTNNPGNDPLTTGRPDPVPTEQGRAPASVMEKASTVKIVVFDVDGVLTDGGIHLDNEGREHKVFYVRDGLGIKMLRQTGVSVAVITGRDSPVVVKRMAELGIRNYFQGCDHKGPAFDTLLARLGYATGEAAFVGDDIVDLPPMDRAGLGIAVADAHPLVRQRADWQTPSAGGRGAVRDVCEMIMSAQGTLTEQCMPYTTKVPTSQP